MTSEQQQFTIECAESDCRSWIRSKEFARGEPSLEASRRYYKAWVAAHGGSEISWHDCVRTACLYVETFRKTYRSMRTAPKLF